MAIAEMQKVTLIALTSQKEEILRELQEFQEVELGELPVLAETPPATEKAEVFQWEKNIRKTSAAIQILKRFDKKSALQKMRAGRSELTLSQLAQKVEDSSWKNLAEQVLAAEENLNLARVKQKENRANQAKMQRWQRLDLAPSRFGDLTSCQMVAGTVAAAVLPEWQSGLTNQEKSGLYWEELFADNRESGYFLLYRKEADDQVEDLMRLCSFSLFDDGGDLAPKEQRQALLEGEKQLIASEEAALAELEKAAKQSLELQLAEEYFETLILREGGENSLLFSNRAFLLEGFIATAKKEELQQLLERRLDKGSCYLEFSPIEEDELDQVPTILKNNAVFTPFETLTEMYSIPKYGELDPTPFMAPFYLVFFGMMVADFGYGLVMMIGTLLAKKFLKLDRGLAKSVDFFFFLAFPTMIWGLIYGSIFGAPLPFYLISTTTDIVPILIISVFFGWLQLMVGLSLNAYQSLKKKDILASLADGFSWLSLLLGLMVIVLAQFVFQMPLLTNVGIGLCLLAAALILFVPVVAAPKSPIKGFFSGLYNLYSATGYIGDLVSYTRLMALGIAGGSIAVAFNTIIVFLPLPARLTIGVVLALALHALNLFLSLLGAYVHGIRLQYVEFFSKFYTGGGRKFKPFKAAEKYIYVKTDQSK